MVRTVLGKDGRKHIFQNGKHILLSGKGHFHIQLIELAGRAVPPGVLIPEAGGYLEIAVKSGGHQQLLKLLGRLGQCVKFTRMLPGGHQIVPGSLRRGCCEDGRGDLQKPLFFHSPAQG